MPEHVIEGITRDWRDIVLRLQQMTRNDQGASVLDIRILCIRGRPAYWFRPNKRTIEPASAAKAFCDALEIEPNT